jgi:two-component sensor histidine kinase
VVSVDLPPHPTSATRARKLAREHLATCPPDVVDVVALLVTELASNAVLHARTDFHLWVEIRTDRVRISVRDASEHKPIPRHYDAEDATGRGLALVEMLANEWGVDDVDGGKVVWCEVVIQRKLA